jgi:pimeloyl-ACP methyl ester carboxylesterase
MPTAAGIYYAQFDEGHKDQPPIILIHGAGSSHLVWPSEIRRLVGQRVMAVDLPGHGKSGGVGLQTISSFADQMVEFLAALGLYQAVFVGHSMGGAIALEMAIQHPTHVAGLGLISTGAYMGVDPSFLENLANPLTVPSALAIFRQRAFGLQANPALIERCMLSMKETRSSVLYSDWRACAEFDQREAIARAESPTWVIVGSDDQITPVAYAHFLAGKLPAARLQIIPGAGHLAVLEHPARIAQGLQQFLAALAAARSASARVRLPTPAPVSAINKNQLS